MELLFKGTQLHVEGVGDALKIDWQMPQLSTKQAVKTLRKMGVEMITCEREADALLADIFSKTPGAYAVAGQDSDFFLIEGIRYVPLESLSVEGEGEETVVTGKMFTAESVAGALQLPVSRLFELAWLVGNDHSADLLDKSGVAAALGLATVSTKNKGSRCLPKDVAAFLAQLPADVELVKEPRLLALDSAKGLSLSLEECRVFYSGKVNSTGGSGAAGEEEEGRDALHALLCAGLRDTSLPSWVLAVYRRRVFISSVKTESMYPGCESEIDLTLRPLRRALYSLLVPADDDGSKGRVAVTEHVRVGHARKEVVVETLGNEVLAQVVGSGDLVELRKGDVRQRQHTLHLLAHLVADPLLLALDAYDVR